MGAFYVSSTVLGAENIVLTRQSPCPCQAYTVVWENNER